MSKPLIDRDPAETSVVGAEEMSEYVLDALVGGGPNVDIHLPGPSEPIELIDKDGVHVQIGGGNDCEAKEREKQQGSSND